ncbi:HTH domain-containing protein [Candidatus Pacearchaeota archaeon]|nr:HTH domain-containing protein [Candidatus Pacearchaeota archaeon]
MDEESIKEAFLRVKEDITFLKQEANMLKLDLQELKELISEIKNSLESQKNNSTHQQIISTDAQKPSTHDFLSTDNLPLKALKSQDLVVSIGNEGVSTDRQTHRQTDRHTGIPINMDDAAQILSSLDNLKKELRLKLKKMTKQEMLIFSLIYQLEERGQIVDYKLLSEKLAITESSVRDHIQRLLSKGIPVDKERVNNKKIVLHIPQEFKKIASLSAILQLREL